MTRIRGLIITSVVALVLMVALPIMASSPANYDNTQSIVITNNTGSAITNGAARVSMNVLNLINGGFIASSGADYYLLDTSGGTQAYPMLQGFATPANDETLWVALPSVANGASRSLTAYMGGNTSAADLTQRIFLRSASESVEVPYNAAFDITTNLTIDLDGVRIGAAPTGTVYLLNHTVYDVSIGADRIVDFHVGAGTASTTTDQATGALGNATLVGDAAFTASAAIGAWAVDLDGNNDYLYLASAGSTIADDIFAGGGSVEVYINADAASASNNLLSKTSGGTQGWVLETTTSGCAASTVRLRVIARFSTTDGDWDTDDCVITPSAGWQRVSMTYNSDSVANNPIFYLDGASVASATTTSPVGTYQSDASDRLEFSLERPSGEFNGQVDDIRIWNDIRTASEVSANWNVALEGNETGLVGYWPWEAAIENTLSSASALTANTDYDILATYDGATMTLVVNNATTTTAQTGSISTSATSIAFTGADNSLVYMDRMRLGDTSIASPTYQLDLSFEPNEMDQGQAGNSGNSWTWTGNVYDQSSNALTGTYTFVRDTTNIAVTAGPVTTTAAAAAAGAETNPTIVSGDATLIADPYVEGTTVADFGFPLSLLATSAQAGSIPLMWFAGTFAIAASALVGFVTFRGTKTPAWTILMVMMSLGVLIYITPIPNITIYMVVPVCLALVMLIPRSFEAVE
jgi:hypothetical protein